MPVFRTKRRTNPPLWGGTYLYSLYKGVLPGARGSFFMPPRALPAAYYATSSSTIYQSLDEVRLELSASYPALLTYFKLLVTTFHWVIFILSRLFCS